MKYFILGTLFLIALFSCKSKEGDYVCTPCNLECDQLVFNEPGTCPHCRMDLILVSPIESKETLVLNNIDLQEGSGAFLIEGGKGKVEKTIKVFYYRPEDFTKDSKVLLVIPGAGRNGDSYRDAWIEESEKYGVLILSPQYPELAYPFEEYHLGGIISSSNMMEKVSRIENTNQVLLDEDGFTFEMNFDSETYIFNDFDRIFDAVKIELNLTTETYDAFGHSAGGHILHRMAIFHLNSKANKIYAGNSSFYTLPNFDLAYPFGMKNTLIKKDDLKKVFAQQLVVLLGEQDNENETGGTFLRSKTSDNQGLHRLARGNYFYETAKKRAQELDLKFNWKLHIVANTGHNHEEMGQAVGELLYGEK